MIKKILAVAVFAVAMASCSSKADSMIDKINSCSTIEELAEVTNENDLHEAYKTMSPGDQKRVEEALAMKLAGLMDGALIKGVLNGYEE